MKPHLPLLLLAAISAGMAAADNAFTASDATADLGNIMYVGDSITHGEGSATYRWQMHKIFVDNGITYNAVGVNQGNRNGGYAAGIEPVYGGSAFNNVHSSRSSIRAYNVSGRTTSTSYLEGTNISQWLGLDDDYTGTYRIDPKTETPDTFVVLLGTNDLLSDPTKIAAAPSIGSGSNLQTIMKNLIGYDSGTGEWDLASGDMNVIIGAMKEANPEANIIVQTIPTWSPNHSNNNAAADYAAIHEYNARLEEWGKLAGVTIVQTDKGMIDVANTEKPYSGVPSMFGDGLHPSAQGDLIMAGNLAKAMGYAGRSAGQARRDGADFNIQTARLMETAVVTGSISLSDTTLTFGDGASLSYSWEEEVGLTSGYTVEFSLAGGLGNGYADLSWDGSNHFALAIGDGLHSGLLNINEAYIQWGDTILYSIDTSTLTDTLRVAYVRGDSTQNLATGYYVWLDDMLIGEALGNVGDASSGVTLTNGTGGTVAVSGLVLDSTGSWAPSTDLFVQSELIIPPLTVELGAGSINWLSDKDNYYNDNSESGEANSSSDAAIRNTYWDSSSGAEDRVVGGTINSGTATQGLRVTSGTYTGDVWLSVESMATGASGMWNAIHTSGTLTGDAYLRFINLDQSSTWGTVFAAVSGNIDGNAYMEFSSQELTVANGTYDTVTASVAGGFNADITGKVTMVFNAGTFKGNIIGGNINTAGKTIGSTDIYINGGTFEGDIYAGSAAGSVSGNSSITITGNGAVILGRIDAGNYTNNKYSAAVINGNASVTIDGVADSDEVTGFHKYEGTISGGERVSGTRTLYINNSQLENFAATLENFDKVAIGAGTDIGLMSLGGASELSLLNGSRVTLSGGAYNGLTLGNAGEIVLKGGASMSLAAVGDENLSGSIVLDGASFDGGGVVAGNLVEARQGSVQGVSHFKGAFLSVNATGDVTFSDVSGSQLSALNVLTAGARVIGLEGDVSLAESSLTLNADALEENGAVIQFADGGDGSVLSVTDSLTLHFSSDLLEMMQASGEDSPMAGEGVYTVYLTNGDLDVAAENIVFNGLAVTDVQVWKDQGAVSFRLVPEPATVTLGLLALAALAARRRRS